MPDFLRSLWAEPRSPHPPARVWRDWALVAVLVPLAVLEGLLRPELSWRVVSVAVVVALVPTLLWRRTRPLLMLAIGFGVSGVLPVLLPGAALETYTIAFLLILPYALVRWGSGREAVLGAAVVLGKVGLTAASGQLRAADLVAGFAVLCATAALGLALRYRARARQRELAQVKLLERERLARDLHDTVAHHVSAMAIRAQAGLALAPTDPAAATDALRVIEAEASRALAEMRGMVRVLRHDRPAEPAPAPRLADLATLAEPARSGPPVEVGVSGDLGDVPAPVGAAIFRLAQESVTNARRHARHATRIEVRVSADPTAVRLRVTDDGEGGGRPAGAPGYGLLGMAERAGLLGGTCEAGPDPVRGWTVTAVLPRSGAPA
ncbi:histidine kinase [Amorphoplanes nipponensis]|uniref:histidine kinase n=1 Tax=Actinoplanes nipponensis TaxID=135950 RepID=A0A919MJV6_9ACTN|nr:histidine kinase [Actinoplanes nipponensis]GIE47856.1 two-component sensor histidine kinase [Actinoplanes nipponensis]